MATRSPDLDRIAAHMPRPPSTVIPTGSGPTDLVAVFDDAPDAATARSGLLVARFAAGERGVTVYAARP